MKTAIFSSLISLLLSSNVAAFTSGAGGCDGGAAAVSSLHLSQPTLEEGTLEDFGVVVTLGDTPLTPGVQTFVQTGVEYTIVATAASDAFMRGALIRIETAGEFILDTEDPSMQSASACAAPVVGVTHIDATEKPSVSAFFQLDTPGDVIVDVTIVWQNSDSVSRYGYSGFTLTAGATLPPEDFPTMAPMAGGGGGDATEFPTVVPVGGGATMAPMGVGGGATMAPMGGTGAVATLAPAPLVVGESDAPTIASIMGSDEPTKASMMVSDEPTEAGPGNDDEKPPPGMGSEESPTGAPGPASGGPAPTPYSSGATTASVISGAVLAAAAFVL